MAGTWGIIKNLWDTFDNNPDNQRTVDAMKGMLGLLPASAGDVASGLLAADDVRRGDYTSAALNGVGVLPFIPSMAGMLKGKGDDIAKAIRQPTKYEQAHEVARQNAVKMLGLPENNTAMDRAKALGFRDGEYHGTNNDISEFSLLNGGEKTGNPNASLGVFTTPNTQEASRYATGWKKEGANVMPLMVRDGNVYNMPFKELDDMAMLPWRMMQNDPLYDPNKVIKFGDVAAQKEAAERLAKYEKIAGKEVSEKRKALQLDGYDSAVVNKGKPTQETILFNPNQLRSRFAAFDPARINEPDLLGFADPRILPWVTGAGLLGAGGMYYSGE